VFGAVCTEWVEFRAAAPAGERILYASGPQDQQPPPSPDRHTGTQVRF
jgi:hypothetical protein